MPRCLALLALRFALPFGVLAAVPAVAQDAPACPGAVTLTHAEIEASGAVYLADLLRLLPPVRRATVDGFSWRLDSGLGVPGGAPAPLLLVDGVPVDLGFLGTTDLEELPVPLPDLARVTFCPAPTPVAGRWAGGGTLRFETRAPEGALHAQGSWQIGNETGDPGPYRYTDRETPNVDKSGPDVEGALRYEAPPVAGTARLRALRSYATDLALHPRTSAATQRPSRSQRLVTAEVGGEVGRGARHAFRLGGRYVSSLSFFEAAGRELPLRRHDADLGVRGPLLGGLRYRLGARLQQADAEDSRLAGFDPRWRYRALTAALHNAAAPEADGWHYGASLVRTDARGAALDAGFALGTVYGTFGRTGRTLDSRTALALTTTGHDIGAKATQTLTAARRDGHLALTLALDRRLPEEAPGYGFWRARGATGFEREAVGYVPAAPVPSTEVSARLDGALRLFEEKAALQGGLQAWAARGLFVERPALGLSEDAATAVGTVTAVPDAEGGTAGAWIALSGTHGSWQGTVFYGLLAPLGGSDAFAAAWARVPRHRAGAALTLRPGPSFALNGRVEALSATRWPGYAAVDGVVTSFGHVYTDGTPTLVLLDLAAEQGLWARRARVSLLFRNLLNAEERYHPLGGVLAFRLYARVTVALDGPFWVGPRSRSAD